MNRILFVVFLFIVDSVSAQNSKILAFVDSIPEASISFCLKDVVTSKLECEYDEQKCLAPASVLKLITTITAYDVLGANFKFASKVEYVGKISGSILDGSLLIRGSGDPTWNSKYFKTNDVFYEIVNMLNEIGIKRITKGIVIAEDDIDADIPRTWIWEDIANYYGARAKAINLYDNTYSICFSSKVAGSTTSIINVSPVMSHLKIENNVLASKENRDNAWIFGGQYSNKRVVKGTIPENRSSFVVKGSIENTNDLFAQHLFKKMSDGGIICKEVISFKKMKSSQLLDIIYSPSLVNMVLYTNRRSVNLFAEALYKRLNLELNGEDFMNRYWKGRGLDIHGLKLYDGSGISRFNMVSSRFITDLLIYANKSDYNKQFEMSLPTAGKNGTIRSFGKDTCLELNLKAKTGSMKSVRAYAGYITIKGRKKAFSLIVNNYDCSNKKIIFFIEKLLIDLCK